MDYEFLQGRQHAYFIKHMQLKSWHISCSFNASFNYVFTQQICNMHLGCAKYAFKHQGYSHEKNRPKILTLWTDKTINKMYGMLDHDTC